MEKITALKQITDSKQQQLISKLNDVGIKVSGIKSSEDEKFYIVTSKGNFLIECDNIELLQEKLILNAFLNKKETDGKKVSDCIITGDGTEIDLETENEMQKYTLLKLDDVKINDKNLLSLREATQQLVKRATTRDERGKKYVDFDKEKYPKILQDYLLESLYGKKIKLPPEALQAIESYKGGGYKNINNFLRGKFDELSSFHESKRKIIEDIIKLAKIAEAFPSRKFNIMLGRLGSNSHNIRANNIPNNDPSSKTIGDECTYDSLVSFSTDEGSAASPSTVCYKRILNQNVDCIPIELIAAQNFLNLEFTESEILTLPFKFTVMDFQQRQSGENYDKIAMGKTKEMDIYKLLNKRIGELEQSLLNTDSIKSENEKQKIMAEIKELFQTVKDKKREKIKLDISDLKFDDELTIEEAEIKKIEQKKNEVIKRSSTVKTNRASDYSLQDALYELKQNGSMETLLDQDTIIQNDENQYHNPNDSYDIHGASHTRRVNFFATLIMNMENINSRDREIVFEIVKNHDIGRKNDLEDTEHGNTSAKKVENLSSFNKFNDDDKKLIQFVISQHSVKNSDNQAALDTLDENIRERYQQILNIVKDADKLDRVRLDPIGNNKEAGLDITRLSLESSKKLESVAYEAYSKLLEFLELEKQEQTITNNMPSKQNIFSKLFNKLRGTFHSKSVPTLPQTSSENRLSILYLQDLVNNDPPSELLENSGQLNSRIEEKDINQDECIK